MGRRGTASNLVFVGVKVDPRQLERLDALAAVDQRSRSWVIRQLLARALSQVTRTAPQAAVR